MYAGILPPIRSDPMWKEDGQICMCIEDNGRGFNPDKVIEERINIRASKSWGKGRKALVAAWSLIRSQVQVHALLSEYLQSEQ